MQKIGYQYSIVDNKNDTPTMHVQKEFGIDDTTTPTSTILTGLTRAPEYHRLNVVGGSFSTKIKGVIFRGEGAYYNGTHFQSEASLVKDAITEKDYLNCIFGLDFNIGSVKFSTQFIQKLTIVSISWSASDDITWINIFDR